MAKAYVLDRVAADLARGRTHPAIQRLSSLVAAHPTDLDLRHRLAMLHRRVGNRVQAGRWDYLTAGASAGDTTAFERAFPSALARLREIRWPHRPTAAATEYARARLTALFRAAEAERAGRPGPARQPASAPPAKRYSLILRSAVSLRSARRGWRIIHRVRSGSPGRAVAVGAAAVTTLSLAGIGVVTILDWIIR